MKQQNYYFEKTFTNKYSSIFAWLTFNKGSLAIFKHPFPKRKRFLSLREYLLMLKILIINGGQVTIINFMKIMDTK